MSAQERPDLVAFRELEALVRHLTQEMANFRKRALAAEAKLRDLSSTEGGAAAVDAVQRVTQLEKENIRLRGQVETAVARTKGMLARVRFLRQQAQDPGPVTK
jgi:hypothetical protein